MRAPNARRELPFHLECPMSVECSRIRSQRFGRLLLLSLFGESAQLPKRASFISTPVCRAFSNPIPKIQCFPTFVLIWSYPHYISFVVSLQAPNARRELPSSRSTHECDLKVSVISPIISLANWEGVPLVFADEYRPHAYQCEPTHARTHARTRKQAREKK